MGYDLENKTIIITGASRGIGRSIACSYAKYGAKLILLARNISDLNKLSDELSNKYNNTPTSCPFNLCSATLEDYQSITESVTSKFGKIDGLLLNAGILGKPGPIEHYNLQSWYQVLQVNLNSSFILIQNFLPLLKNSPKSKIIFTIPESHKKNKPFLGAYNVAASGIESLSSMLKTELLNTNISIHNIYLDKIDTKLRAEAYPAEDPSTLTPPDLITNRYLELFQVTCIA